MSAALSRWEREWAKDPFYTDAVVLGIDVGIRGIGIWLRRGQTTLFGRTYLVSVPEAAPLAKRRAKRAGRRARASRRRRLLLLRNFCRKYDLPEAPLDSPNHSPFRLRLDAITPGKGLKSPEALVACIHHLIKHRGFDYHLTEEGAYPWGEELDHAEATKWLKTAACSPEFADAMRFEIQGCDWKDAHREAFETAVREAVERYQSDPIRQVLVAHFKDKQNVRPAARRHAFPRELVEAHLRAIVDGFEKKHSFFKDRFGEALDDLIGHSKDARGRARGILHYHRKPPGALAERKIKDCPYASTLWDGRALKCAKNEDAAIRRFKLLEFLSTRTAVGKDGVRHYATESTAQWLFDLLDQDIAAFANRSQRPDLRQLRGDFSEKMAGGFRLAPDKSSHNGDYFDQLRALLKPDGAVLKRRATMSAEAAEEFWRTATREGLSAANVRAHLEDYFELRRSLPAGRGAYHQVEFLLGPPASRDQLAVHGVLHRVFAEAALAGALGGKTKPDFVVIETPADLPRNSREARKLQQDQKARRAFKEALREKWGLGERATDEQVKRVLLFDQQRGICPYTGRELGQPLDRGLQIDHIFPRELGGISEMVNLVLTHSRTNAEKGRRTPVQAFGRDGVQAHIAQMQWNPRKREIFLWESDQTPEWGNLTRVSQLSRQLIEAVAHWLGIRGQPKEIARRIGTPSGYLTAVCRRSWRERLPEFMRDRKPRGNLRHHLYDAAVLAHIPPGPGLNHVRYGGLFFHEEGDRPGSILLRALSVPMEDLEEFERSNANLCLVVTPRPRKSRQQRFEETIYGLSPGTLEACGGQMRLSAKVKQATLRARKPIRTPDGVAVKNVEEALRDSGIPPAKLPAKLLRKWVDRGGNAVLRLADGTEVRSVPTSATKEQSSSLAAHRNHLGHTIGYRIANETFEKCEVWQADRTDRKTRQTQTIYYTVQVPPRRNLAMARSRGTPWSPPPLGKRYAFLRNRRKVGEIRKGDEFLLLLNRQGEICFRTTASFCSLWYKVVAIKSNGQITLRLAEHEDSATTPFSQSGVDVTERKPSSADVLAQFLHQRVEPAETSADTD